MTLMFLTGIARAQNPDVTDIASQIRRLKNRDPKVSEIAIADLRRIVKKAIKDHNKPELQFLAVAGPDESSVLAMLRTIPIRDFVSGPQCFHPYTRTKKLFPRWS